MAFAAAVQVNGGGPDKGTLTLGQTVALAYLDQVRSDLDPTKTVWESISGAQDQIALGKALVNSRAYAARFNFFGPDQQKNADRPGKRAGGMQGRRLLPSALHHREEVYFLTRFQNTVWGVSTILLSRSLR